MDTIAAIATPPGSAALAIVRLSGPGALSIAQTLLAPSPAADHPLPARTALLRTVFDAQGPIDQAVITYFPGPRSSTGDDVVEFSVHGSTYIQSRLLKALLSSGARPARPGEFTQKAFLNGRMDLSQAEAVCALIESSTELSHRTAWRQLDGRLSRCLAQIRKPILDFLVHLEALLDHPEEDMPALSPQEAASRLDALVHPIEELAGTFHTGRLFRDGLRICIVGRPNAGKSSLLNALLDSNRAIVCPEAGTTRDTIEEPCDLEGLKAVLIDTAGLGRGTGHAAEEESLRRTHQAVEASDMALLVIDSSRPPDDEDLEAHQKILAASRSKGRLALCVLNKSDLPSRVGAQREPYAQGADCARVSALHRTGLAQLRQLILRHALASQAGQESHSVIINARHHQALSRCAKEIQEGKIAMSQTGQAWEDRLARHLREALACLDEITGPSAPDEVLQEIFSRFCVGK